MKESLVQQVGWTLLHFLWQGSLIAVGFALVQFALLRHLAVLRYFAACAAMLVMLAAPVITFSSLRSARPVVTTSLVAASTLSAADVGDSDAPASVIAVSPDRVRSRYLDQFLPSLVACWAFGVALLSVRLSLGACYVFRLRRCPHEPLDEISGMLDQLRQSLGVSRPVRLLKSALVEVPTVVGWLRPLILLPGTAVTGLTPAQLEGVLAHELAHIRRHDYLVNLLQNVLETLLFFHPAVWWVSRQVRIERENCCDDIAVAACGDRLCYLKALATLEDLRAAPAPFVLAANGGSLVARVRRLCGMSTDVSQRSSGRFGCILLVGIVLGLSISLHAALERGRSIEALPAKGPLEPSGAPIREWSGRFTPMKTPALAGYSVKTRVDTLADAFRYTWTVRNQDQASGLVVFVVEVPLETVVLGHTVPGAFTASEPTARWVMQESTDAQVDPNDGKAWLPAATGGNKWLIWSGEQPASAYPPGSTATFSLTTDAGTKPGRVRGIATTYTPHNDPHYYFPFHGQVLGPSAVEGAAIESLSVDVASR